MKAVALLVLGAIVALLAADAFRRRDTSIEDAAAQAVVELRERVSADSLARVAAEARVDSLRLAYVDSAAAWDARMVGAARDVRRARAAQDTIVDKIRDKIDPVSDADIAALVDELVEQHTAETRALREQVATLEVRASALTVRLSSVEEAYRLATIELERLRAVDAARDAVVAAEQARRKRADRKTKVWQGVALIGWGVAAAK